jgi:2-oxoglutarate ferredoxin oxidoreductase subunit beta
MVFGKNRDKGIRLNGLDPEVVTLGRDGVTEKDLLVHDENAPEPTLAYLLSRMSYPEFPVPVGVFYSAQRPTLEEILTQQGEEIARRKGPGDIEKLIRGTETWTVA